MKKILWFVMAVFQAINRLKYREIRNISISYQLITPYKMKLVALVGLFLISFTATSQVWFENFSGEADGATSGTAAGGTWTTTLPTGGAASFSRLDVGAPYGGIFRIDNTATEGVWRSDNMNISALGEVALEVLMGGNDALVTDYVRAFYKIDGGPEIMFAEVYGTVGVTVFTASSAVVSGNNLQIVMRGLDTSPGGFRLMGFDDVTVTDISVLYSRASTAWNAVGTWSTTGFGGLSCGCIPTATSKVIIGNNRTVTMPADGNASGVEIQNTGTLQWTANNVDLTLERGGALNVQNGGQLTRAATTVSSIIFTNYTYTNTIAGTVNIGVMTFNGSGNSTINNSGTLTLASAVGLFINGGNGYVFTNTGTINITEMDLNTGDLTVNNSGTINQSGNFTDVDAGSAFNNLINGTWNFGGTTVTGVRLFASNNSNTFNYNSAGVQSIISPQDAYSNLILSNASAKTALGNFSVRGNWTRSGTATFVPAGFTVTLTGTVAQTIAAVGGETFANLTINNTFATPPQITLSNPVTVSTVLTMTDGNVNLNGNLFTITSAAAGALVHSLAVGAPWMYGGSIIRSFPTTAIAIGTVAGFFPLGGSTDFRPFFVAKTSIAASSGTITVSYTNATTATNISFADGASTIQRRHDSFWTVAKSAGLIAGVWDLRAGGTGFTIGAVNQIRLTRLSDAIGIGTSGATTGTAPDVRANRTGLTPAQLVNNFYIASTNAASSPLPILLSYYRAHIEGDEVISTWKTLQEINNHFFTVQKTVDFETFYEVGRFDGNGNSQEEHTYTLIDDSPFTGRSYYRLKQTDFDGEFTFSDPVMIDYQGSSALLKAYPNPFNGNKITIELKGLNDVPAVPLQIYNQQGQKVMDLILHENGPGVIKEEIIFPSSLPQGLYIIKSGKTLQLTRKIVVN